MKITMRIMKKMSNLLFVIMRIKKMKVAEEKRKKNIKVKNQQIQKIQKIYQKMKMKWIYMTQIIIAENQNRKI